jgi:hypothetical protein
MLPPAFTNRFVHSPGRVVETERLLFELSMKFIAEVKRWVVVTSDIS